MAYSQSTKIKKRNAFSGWPMIIGWLAMLIFALHAGTHMVGAGDTWVAMACGRHFINHGVDTVEPFSANSHKAGPTEEEIKTWPGWAQWITDKVGLKTVKYWHPTGWINQNWLTHVIFYWLTHKSPFADADNFSFNSLVYWKFAIYILAVICVYYTGRVLGVNPALSAVFACFAMFVGRSFFDIRPAGFSNLLVAVFLLVLVLATYRNILYIWLIVPLSVFWCNVHGGYIYAFIMLVNLVALQLLTMLPKRWTISLHSILTWGTLYALTYKFLNGEVFESIKSISPTDDRLFYLLLILITASFIITAIKRTKDEALYFYHIVATIIIFVSLLSRFFPSIPSSISHRAFKETTEYIRDSRLSFIIITFGLMGLGFVLAFMKNRLLCVKPKQIYHTIATGLVAFAAVIIFNPFHLTNLTHTFVVSVSEHAKMWRTVNEWRPAFEWTNPVGTGFSFFVLLILSIVLLLLWQFSRLFEPRFLKASKNEIRKQEKEFAVFYTIFGCSAVVFIGWVTFISFSFLNLSTADFFICAVFAGILLASVYKNVHFIYLVVLLTLLALYSGNPKAGYTGRYIYPFVVLPAYVILHIVASAFSKTIKIKLWNIVFVILAASAALILMMVLINPFNLELPSWSQSPFGSITQALKSLPDLHRVWRPKYEYIGGNPLNYKRLFIVLYAVNAVSIVIWLAIPYLISLLGRQSNQVNKVNDTEKYHLPRIDLTLIVIVGLTIYMAICSRRFITIAAVAACPLIAMFIDQMIRTMSALRNFYKNNRFTVPQIPRNVELFFIFIGAVVVLSFGTWWGLKFKRVYLDPWPEDPVFSSIFMRMTNSNIKPFYACRFIKDNKLKGKMFNYWTEGGFIAWAQQPDTDTGKTPLQLFMDGRAQAAYDHEAFQRWSYIFYGGDPVRLAKLRRAAIDYKKVGQWISEQLRAHDVWIVLMPVTNNTRTFVRSMESSPDWKIVFLNNKQRLYIDIKSAQGQELFRGIPEEKTLYPDEFSKDLIIAHNILSSYKTDAAMETGLEYAVKAFELNPSAIPLQEIIFAAKYPRLGHKVYSFCKNYIEALDNNKNLYTKQDGYRNRVMAAFYACEYLRDVAKSQKKIELAEFYDAKAKEYSQEQKRLIETKRW